MLRKTREHVLHRVGEELLCEAQPSVSEIAAQLGFADVTAFGKAFRRWSGETPSAYRTRSLRAAPD